MAYETHSAIHSTSAVGQATAPGVSLSASRPLRVDLVFPRLPPTLDGIGDHTANLADALARQQCAVRILTAQPTWDALPGVQIEHAFSMDSRRGVRSVIAAVQDDPPDWLALQFNQFSYGHLGLNPYLPFVIRRLQQLLPHTRIAWIAHEDFVPASNWKFALMTTWQRAQFWMLGQHADLIFFTIAPWVKRYQSWFPKTPVYHLPVGSNIPRSDLSHADARRHLGIAESTFVAGLFGSINAARLLSHVQRVGAALHRRHSDFLLLYVGPDGDRLQQALGHSFPVRDAGPLPALEVARCFAAMDLHLAPYVDGVSTRRGSFIAGLQQGIPTVGTLGPLTDRTLRQMQNDAFLLAPVSDPVAFERHALSLYTDPVLRTRIGAAGQHFFERSFSWQLVANTFLSTLHAHGEYK